MVQYAGVGGVFINSQIASESGSPRVCVQKHTGQIKAAASQGKKNKNKTRKTFLSIFRFNTVVEKESLTSENEGELPWSSHDRKLSYNSHTVIYSSTHSDLHTHTHTVDPRSTQL